MILYHKNVFYSTPPHIKKKKKRRDAEASEKCFNFHHSDEDLVSTVFIALEPQKTPYSVY